MMQAPRISARDAAWPGTKLWLVAKINDLRDTLERSGLKEADYQLVRGRLAALREIIAEVEPSVIEGLEPPRYT